MKSNIQNRGFTLLGTVFILLILSLVGVYLLKMGTTKTQILNYQLLNKKAELASYSALEIAAHKFQENPNECPKQTLLFNEVAVGLKGFSVGITCSQMLAFPQKSPRFFAVQLEAKATRGHFGERDFVSHSMNRLIFIEQ